MGSIGNLQDGQSFKITKYMPEAQAPAKDLSKMTPTEMMKYNQASASNESKPSLEITRMIYKALRIAGLDAA